MTTEEYIKYCSNIINEGWNPDDPANDDFDRMADDYEEEQKEKERLSKELRKAAGLEEAMSVDDILNKHKERKDSTQDKESESNIKNVIIKELYDGYCLCEVEMKDGSKKDFEFEITQDEIDDMISKLSAKAKSKNFKKIPDTDDAAIAIIRLRVDPNDNLKWFFGDTNKDLDQWFMDREIENDMLDAKYDGKWADKQKKWDMYAGSGDDTDPNDENWTDQIV